jgi:hypothetical protein
MSVAEVVKSFEGVEQFRKVRAAIDFKEAYRAETGHRPSLVSVIALYQEYKARAEKAEAKIAELEAAGGPL